MNTTDKITGKTASGFEFELSPNIFDDWEIMELMGRVQKDDKFAIFDLFKKMLGDEQLNRLKEHCREEDGRIPLSRMNDELTEIITAQDSAKKS